VLRTTFAKIQAFSSAVTTGRGADGLTERLSYVCLSVCLSVVRQLLLKLFVSISVSLVLMKLGINDTRVTGTKLQNKF